MSKLHESMWIVLPVLFIATSLACADDLTIVADGRSDYAIVLAVDATPAEKFAAEELALHIKQMSGVELKITDDSGPLPAQAILLGRPRYLAELGVAPDWKQLGKEGYLIRTHGDYLIISGGQPRGTMYGVYDLLQKYWGCRWFTFDTSYIPQQATLTVPVLDAIIRPVFELRDLMIAGNGNINGYWFAHHLDKKYVARVRWNFVTRDWGGKDASHGGTFQMRSLGHNYLWLVDPSKYGAAHPEYYALVDGERLNHTIRGNEVELCLSNPDVARIVANTLTSWLRESPDLDMLFVGQSDTKFYCQCDNCEATRKKYGGWDSTLQVELPSNLPNDYRNKFGGFAGWQIEFINRVADILEKEFPNTRIGTFAYWHALKPPRGIKAHKNVVVWYCPYPNRCYSHSVESGPINDEFSQFSADLRAWKRIANHVYIYDYWLGTWMGQPVNIPTMSKTMRFYRELGVEGVLLDGLRGIPGGFEWLTFWLWSQLMWNPDFDVDQGIDEFCQAYYGAAGPYIKQYIAMASLPKSYRISSARKIDRFTEDLYKPIKSDHLKNCQLTFRDRVMTIAAINRGYKLFEAARSAVANDPKSAKHVEYTRMALQFMMLDRLSSTDPRLKEETELLLQLTEELEIGYIYRLTRGKFQEAMRKKIEQNAQLYPPKRVLPTDKKAGFGITSPTKARYIDGNDCLNLLPKLRVVEKLPADGWLFKKDPTEAGLGLGYYKLDYLTEDMIQIKIGKHWDDFGYKELTEGWYRLNYICPVLPADKRVFLYFEAVDDSAWVYINGKIVAWYDTNYPTETWNKPFLLDVTGELKSEREHQLVIRIRNVGGAGGIHKSVSLMVEK